MRLKGKNVLVVGLGRSGVAATRFLISQGARVAVTDQRQAKELPILEEFQAVLERHLGGHSPEIFEGRDLICLSPGVPGDLPGLKRARRKRIPILGEMGLAAKFLTVPMVAVTGTNGKSTTATLIAEMLKAGGQKVALAGNIGTPLLEVVMKGEKLDRAVVEVSSFQLETMEKFRPEVAVLLNVTEDHLDRYPDFHDYVRAKMRILKDQTGRDWVVFNQEDRNFGPYLRRAAGKKVPFSLQRLLKSGIFFSGGRIVRRWQGAFEEYPLGQVKLAGLHNVENMMASIAAARCCEVVPESIRKTLQTFEGLSHRMQWVRERNGVRFYDDSKGTNVDAVVKSISGFGKHQVILIAGGRDKGSHFAPLREPVRDKVRLLLLIGEASGKIARELKGCTEIREVKTLEAAVAAAVAEAKPGAVVLLSPACASFDQFKNYAERGARFQELVQHA